MHALKRFLLLWLTTALTLWIVDGMVDGLQFDKVESLLLAALVLSVFNLTLKPLLVLITLPLTVVSFGLALPLINGLVLLGISGLVPGFQISGFWMGVLCALAVSFVTFLMNLATGQSRIQGRVRVGRFENGASRPWGGPAAGSSDSDVIDGEIREKRQEKPQDPQKIGRD